MTFRAVHRSHLQSYFLFHPFTAGFPEAALQIVHNALEIRGDIAVHTVAFALYPQLFALCAVEDYIKSLLRQILYRNVKGKAVFLRQSIVIVLRYAALVIVPSAGVNRPLTNGQVFVRNDKVRIHPHKNTEAGAFFTGAEWVIEREHTGSQLLYGNSVLRAGVVL